MNPTPFDGVRVLCRTEESRAGCTELCRDPLGGRKIRVRIDEPAIQQSVLSKLPSGIPVRLAGQTLEVLLPWWDGQTLEEWLYTCKPNLGARRDACLSLLAGLLANPVPPDLIVLSARPENLRFTTDHGFLQILPQLDRWQSDLDEQSMVNAVAGLMAIILTEGYDAWQRMRFPEELQLFLLQSKTGCSGWEGMQQELAALPDHLLAAGWFLRRYFSRLRDMWNRCGPLLLRATAAVLVVAALFSLTGAFLSWRREQKSTWPGMVTVGDQTLNNEEGGKK